MSFRLLVGLVALTVMPRLANTGDLPGGTVPHDELLGLSQTIPSDATGDLYLAYQPHLYVVNGCVPFPAVDVDGNTNAGLNPTGAPSGGCSSSTGQIYVRGGTSGDYYALMYSWYFPKDEPSTGTGHRHDWEGVIVWLSSSSNTSAANIVAVCPSAHGGWDCHTDDYALNGTAPLIKYQSVWPLNHSCGFTSIVGGTQPLITWKSLSPIAKKALETTDFGKANVPFSEINWASNLAKATF